ncbi:MAG: SGNH/GDSL hydrolase family protein [Alistipes sp.]|nr:SGNH/GDSL hydrolase family protein [Alistipes sp.]
MRTILKVCALLIATTICTTVAFAAPKQRYVDASTLTIINKAHNDGLPFSRVDVSKFDIPEFAKKGLSNSTGLAIVFSTDSRNISAKWTTVTKRASTNMTPIFKSGCDLYIKEGNKWVFAGVARPKIGDNNHQFNIVSNMEEGVKECMLYLPMFDTVTSFQIGVDEGATIEAIPSPFEKRVLFVGSSLTHGASAARSGLCYVAKMGRMLNVETPNIGLSGMCKLDDYFANIVCATEADAYIFDTFSNSTKQNIEDRLYNFVKRITEAHPGKPMIFLQTIKRESGRFDTVIRQRNAEQMAAAVAEMARVRKDFPNVFFINPGFDVWDDGEGTIDGSHLNDLGVQRTLDNIMPKVTKILKKYKILTK